LSSSEGRGAHSVSVLTHSRPAQTSAALQTLIDGALQAGASLRFDAEETAKHGLVERSGVSVDVSEDDAVDLCIVLGGDGTILRALRRYAGTQVPVFAVNFGDIGFLATIEPDELSQGVKRALAGDFELLRLPAIALDASRGSERAFNDVAIHRKVGERVAEIAYVLDGHELGSVRCDGLVVATPAGSTGYNLANGGPVMAWGAMNETTKPFTPQAITGPPLARL
jgi:NAD+ kinase